MSRYGKFDDFCRDTGNEWSTLPGTHRTAAAQHSIWIFADLFQSAMYVANAPSAPPPVVVAVAPKRAANDHAIALQ
jgi:hypothetical protein